MRWKRLADSAPPESFFVVSAVFHYLGPAFAVLLFARVDAPGVAWLRIVSAALIFAVWIRPWRRIASLDAPAVRLVAGWGMVLALMNLVFYEAIDRLPLGTVGAIEFLPVVALAAAGVRTRRNALALAFAVAGVALLVDVEISGSPIGLAFAAVNAALFAVYIVLAHRIASHGALSGIDGLGAAMIVAAIAITPFGIVSAEPALTDLGLLAAGIGVGVSSSVIPYVTDQLAMARISRSAYATLVALLPATATVVGVIVLAQIPAVIEVAGISLVVVGVALRRVP